MLRHFDVTFKIIFLQISWKTIVPAGHSQLHKVITTRLISPEVSNAIRAQGILFNHSVFSTTVKFFLLSYVGQSRSYPCSATPYIYFPSPSCQQCINLNQLSKSRQRVLPSKSILWYFHLSMHLRNIRFVLIRWKP